MTRPEPDAGVATVWAAAGVAVVMAALLVALHIASAVVARHRAAAAADLAALAAAALAVQGAPAACARAREIAAANDAELVRCALIGWNAAIEVESGVPLALPGLATAGARALAGPAVAVSESDEAATPLTRSGAGPSASARVKLRFHDHDGEVPGCRRTADAASRAARRPTTDRPAGGGRAGRTARSTAGLPIRPRRHRLRHLRVRARSAAVSLINGVTERMNGRPAAAVLALFARPTLGVG